MIGVGTGFAFAWNLSLTALPLTVAARGLGPAEMGWLLAVEAAADDNRPAIPARRCDPAVVMMAAGLAMVSGPRSPLSPSRT